MIITPRARAIPTPTGKATAIPAIDIAATSKMLDALNTTPPKNALSIFLESAWAISAVNFLPPSPVLPIVNPSSRANNKIPIT